MSIKELKVNYEKLLNNADKTNGLKETVSYLNMKQSLYGHLHYLLCLKAFCNLPLILL